MAHSVDATPTNISLRIYRGDTFRFNLFIRNPSSSVVDLSDFIDRKMTLTPDDGGEEIDFTAEIVDDHYFLILDAAVTAQLPDSGRWYARLTRSDDSVITVAVGPFIVVPPPVPPSGGSGS